MIAYRAIDKCRATLACTQGQYYYDCPMDRLLFEFKGITGAQFQAVVAASQNDEAVGTWLAANGLRKTGGEIKAWSDRIEAATPMNVPEERARFMENCAKVGLNPVMNTTFDWLEADDRNRFICRPRRTL